MTTETLTQPTEPSPTAFDFTDDLGAFAAEMRGEPPAEVEKPAEAQNESDSASEVEETTAETAEDGDEDEPKPERRKLSTTDRINKMTRRMREAEARAAEVDTLREELNALKAAKDLTPAKEADKVTALSEPDPANYQYAELDPQYMRDLARFEAKQEAAQLRASLKQEMEQEQRQSAAQREVAAFQTTVEQIEEAGRSKFQDFDELVVQGVQDGDWKLTREMAVVLTEMPETAPDILYYLATNPEESERVAAMSERRQAMWFGRMEAQLAAKPAPAAKKITQAGAPPASIPKGSGSGGAVRMDDLDDPRALEAIERALGLRR